MSLRFIAFVQLRSSFSSEVIGVFDADDCVFWLWRLKRPGKTNEGCPRPQIKYSRKHSRMCNHGKKKVGQRLAVEKDALHLG